MDEKFDVKYFSNICRICLKFDSQFISVSTSNIISMLQECSSIEVSINDELPNQLCNNCFTQLNNFHNFKQTIEQSDKLLRKVLKKNAKENLVKTEELYLKAEREIDQLSSDSVYTEHKNNFSVNTNDSTEQKSKVSIQETREEISSPLFACAKCDFKCEYIQDLCNHIKEFHDESAATSSSCQNLSNTSLQEIHQNKSKNDTIKCNICNQTFPSKRKLDQHHRVEHGLLYCKLCDTGCKSRYLLDRHVKRIHLNIRPSSNKQPCTVCGKIVSDRYLKDHMKTQHSSDVRQVFTCPKCSKQFLVRYNLDVHMRAEHTENSKHFLCADCGKRFPSRGILNIHLKSHQTGFNWSCDMCDRKFQRKSTMKLHQRTKHLNIRNYACEICEFRFSSREILKRHAMIHTGEKPFKCMLCQRPFRQRGALRTHERLVHGIGELKKRITDKELEKKT